MVPDMESPREVSTLHCPRCGSVHAVCDGQMHKCLDCGYDGTTPKSYGGGQCAVCDHRCPAGYLMCGRHWRMVPPSKQVGVWFTLKGWQQGLVDLEELRRVQDDAIVEVQRRLR